MQDIIEDFRSEMIRLGCEPASEVSISPDDKWNHFRLSGDPTTKKAGSYILKIEDDFGFGAFINRRDGQVHPWVSKERVYISEEEKQARQIKRQLDREASEARRALDQEKVWRQAQPLWDRGITPKADHPYLVKKQILGDFLRQDGEDLLVPMFRDGKMIGYQRIMPDGDKLFLPTISSRGAYCPLAIKDEPKDRIVICEGLATGKSIRQACNLPVIVAFDNGNLVPVAKAMKEKYPDAKIIIAADNDQWTFSDKGRKNLEPGTIPKQILGDDPRWLQWREGGMLTNPGLNLARQAAGACDGAYIVYPEFPFTTADKPTDYNDLAVRMGEAAVKASIDKIPENVPAIAPAVQKPIQHEKNWRENALWKDSDKNILKDMSYNYAMLLTEHPRLEGTFAWDEFHICVMVIACPPWEKAAEFEVHKLTDNDIREADYFIQRLGLALKGSPNRTADGVYAAAMKNSFHPARDYFNKQVWDRVPRLDNWLINYGGCRFDDVDYVRAIGRTWMIAAVKRIYEPGCKFDHMLILEGRQGAGKSTLLKELATFGRGPEAREYFTDTFSIKKCTDKDELAKLNGCLIIELAEMSGFNKTDRDELTSFVTTQKDTYRAPYARELQSYHRQFVLAGTYNPINGIFTDPTGTRRFWPVTVGTIDLERLRKDKEQLWAEAVYRYKTGESLVLSKDLYDKAATAGGERRIVDDWTTDVIDAIRGRPYFEIRDVMRGLNIDVQKRGQSESRRIANILKSEGFERGRKKIAGRSTWVWRPPGSTDMLFDDDTPGREMEVDF